MRIIAGRLKGQLIDSPRSQRTHPMSEQIRGALFNALGDVGGLTVLDAFAGSGAIGFEALSRGARHATLLENDAAAQRSIQLTIRQLRVASTAKLARAPVFTWVHTHTDSRYDIVVADPPYQDLQLASVEAVASLVADDGIFVLSWPGKQPLPKFSNFSLIQSKNYGDAQLAYFRREE